MTRKDCEDTRGISPRRRARTSADTRWAATLIALAFGVTTSTALAGSVRVWPSAVIVAGSVRLSDISELSGFSADVERDLAELAIATSPPAGGTRVIHMDMIRSALAASATNMAGVTLRGATQCEVSHPLVAQPPQTRAGRSVAVGRSHGPVKAPGTGGGESSINGIRRGSPMTFTLRHAIYDYFNAELGRYGGTAEVIFDHTSEQVLALSGPAYEFKIRLRKGSPLGLTPLEVDVLAGGALVQTIPLVVQVALNRRTVVARRSISQGATIRAADVGTVPVSVTRLDELGLDGPAMAVGQRAKRFIRAGTFLKPGMLESVSLVKRGQLVTLVSVAGGVRVTTTAKAAEDGMLGETIKVRAADNKRVEFDAVVVGPGAVRIGSVGNRGIALAMRDQP